MSDAEGYTALGEAETEAANKHRRTSWLSRWRWPLMIGGPVLILIIVAVVILTGGKSQGTDDAYVQVAKAPVAASISGRVVEVLVTENQRVKRGDPLFRLDPRDLATATDESAAKLAEAYGQVMSLKAAYSQAQANVAQAQAKISQYQAHLSQVQQAVTFAASEADRQKALFDAGVGSRDQYDQAAHAAADARVQLTGAQTEIDGAQAELKSAQAAQTAALVNAGNAANLPVDQHPLVQAARADLDRMKLNQSYTVVVALTDGIVTRVDQLQPGSYVNASQTVFWLITGQPWVEANFKEDQLAKMKVGQPATVTIDADPGVKLAGHVESFSPGTGQVFSALPAQNATGNWVKVTQRLPVRIAFDRVPPEMAGRGGLSAHVTVDVTGPGKAAPPPPTSTPAG